MQIPAQTLPSEIEGLLAQLSAEDVEAIAAQIEAMTVDEVAGAFEDLFTLSQLSAEGDLSGADVIDFVLNDVLNGLIIPPWSFAQVEAEDSVTS